MRMHVLFFCSVGAEPCNRVNRQPIHFGFVPSRPPFTTTTTTTTPCVCFLVACFKRHKTASEEFQSKETGYMFGSSDRPEGNYDDGDYAGGPIREGLGDVANAVVNQNKKHRRGRRAESGGDSGTSEAGFRLKFWARQQNSGVGTPKNASVSGARPGDLEQGGSFRNFFHRNKKDELEATLEEEIAELADSPRAAGTGSRANAPRVPPRPSPVHPSARVAGQASEGSSVDLGDVSGGKFKAAVRRALVASRRERAEAERRGRKKEREEQAASEFQGFIQVKDPALDKVCVEYGLTQELAEAKYR